MKYLTSLFVFALATIAVHGQNLNTGSAYDPWLAVMNGNFQIGIPQQGFSENLDRTGIGGGGSLLFRIGHLPLYAGAEFSGMSYDRESRNYTVNIGGFDEEYEVRTVNSIFLMHGVVRFQPLMRSPIRPYLDAMMGTKYLYTRTRLIQDDDDGDSQYTDADSRVELSDWAFSYGGALGIQLDISNHHGVVLDLRCAFLPGSNAHYLVRKPGDGNYDEPIDAFEQKFSTTTLVMPQVGLSFLFSDCD